MRFIRRPVSSKADDAGTALGYQADMRMRWIILALLTPFVFAVPAAGQETKPDVAEETSEAAPTEPVAPYDDQLLRLAEVLGSLHYLRSLCGTEEGTRWRDAMATILSTESPAPKRKARLTARFNRGYEGFAENYSRCTDNARAAAENYRREGIGLSAQIVSRYGR